MNLGQSQGNAILYISPDPYSFILNISDLVQTVLTWKTKIIVEAVVDAAGVTNQKYKVTSDGGDLKTT